MSRGPGRIQRWILEVVGDEWVDLYHEAMRDAGLEWRAHHARPSLPRSTSVAWRRAIARLAEDGRIERQPRCWDQRGKAVWNDATWTVRAASSVESKIEYAQEQIARFDGPGWNANLAEHARLLADAWRARLDELQAQA